MTRGRFWWVWRWFQLSSLPFAIGAGWGVGSALMIGAWAPNLLNAYGLTVAACGVLTIAAFQVARIQGRRETRKQIRHELQRVSREALERANADRGRR